MRLAFVIALLMPGLLDSLSRLAAPGADLHDSVWTQHSETSQTSPDHARWADFLKRYLKPAEDSVNRLDHGAVAPADRAALDRYIADLEAIDPRRLASADALAYWINLYNAATVALVLDHHPVTSIRDIGAGLLEPGPWDRPVATVLGHSLTLNEIEHGIIRPVWNEPRIHYAVNCAAIGCPDLAPEPYEGARIEAQLAQAERRFVNDPRGVRREGNALVLSSIWLWYRDDFAADEAGLLAYLRGIATGRAADALAAPAAQVRYEYDWRLNGAG